MRDESGDVVEIGSDDLLARWRANMRLYGGVPRTRHVLTNPIIELDEAAGCASTRTTFTVFQ